MPNSTTPAPVDQESAMNPAPAIAPTRTIKFTVMQKGTGVALRKVEIKANGKSFYTDPTGSVEIPFDAETQEFVLIRNGFETTTLPAGDVRDTLELDVYMYPRHWRGRRSDR